MGQNVIYDKNTLYLSGILYIVIKFKKVHIIAKIEISIVY